jgi:molecular chaperone DnaK (HSP70)
VAQGESKRFEQNTLLGEVELPGLPKAPRGTLQISVTFALDAGGMLNVSAKETASGRIVQAQLRLVGLPESDEVGAMALRHEQRQTA